MWFLLRLLLRDSCGSFLDCDATKRNRETKFGSYNRSARKKTKRKIEVDKISLKQYFPHTRIKSNEIDVII